MRQRSLTTPAGVTHRYYLCSNTPKACPKVSNIAADAEERVEQECLENHAHRRVRSRVWRDGSDHSAELEQTNPNYQIAARGPRYGAVQYPRGSGYVPPADDGATRQT
ncbi:hypothetical protein ACQ856_17300 [Mycolicibacterium psychrotolerans]|uniref:hypothetical protein n=1 Tax=Mycolicibacterium psychrotolerans TaxID=216929 RepID=UPI003D678D01